jgi:zinc transporter
MVGLRLLIDEHRIISLRHLRLMAVNDIREVLDRSQGPMNPGDFLVAAAGGMVERMGPVIADIDEQIDSLEDQVLKSQSATLRGALSEVRQQAIALRRYLSPQRDVVSRLPMERVTWLDDMQRAMLREIAERTTRYVEDLDSGRERAQIVQDELNNRLADQMNRTMYLLTVVAAILLPPGLLTGLLGINVGGMPGVDSPWAFSTVAVAIVAIAVVEIALLRRLRWI